MTYKTLTGNAYTFVNGRVTDQRHGIVNEPISGGTIRWDGGGLMFRIPAGWVRTSFVVGRS